MTQGNQGDNGKRPEPLNATQRRLLRIYQRESESGLIAVSGGDKLLCPALLFLGVSHRWDHDAGLAAYIARHFAPAEPYWDGAHLKSCLIPEARGHREAGVRTPACKAARQTAPLGPKAAGVQLDSGRNASCGKN